MKSVKINAVLIGPDETTHFDCLGNYEENIYSFTTDNIQNKITIQGSQMIINRRSNDYDLNLLLEENKETNGSLVIEEKHAYLPIKTNKLVVEENYIEANYIIDDIGEFIYKINLEVE